jgi:hypothetical protein
MLCHLTVLPGPVTSVTTNHKTGLSGACTLDVLTPGNRWPPAGGRASLPYNADRLSRNRLRR